jgi:hypothetical protein
LRPDFDTLIQIAADTTTTPTRAQAVTKRRTSSVYVARRQRGQRGGGQAGSWAKQPVQ